MKFLYNLCLLYPYWFLKIICHAGISSIRTIFCFNINEKKIDQFTGIEFEELIRDILKKDHYHSVILTKSSNDYGIDILAKKNSLTYGFQCKRYQHNIGVDAIQQAKAGQAYYKLDIVSVITNSFFTSNAYALAQCNDIKLIDRPQLIKMMKKTKMYYHFIPFYYFLIVIVFSYLSYLLWIKWQCREFMMIFIFLLFLFLFMTGKTLYYSFFQRKQDNLIHHDNEKMDD